MERCSFERRKANQLKKIDKSDKGHFDSRIKRLTKKINGKKEYYTTSSCAGRIVLIKELDKKQENLFLFRTHNKISFSELKKILKTLSKIKYKGMIYFKEECCILHAACKTLRDAQNLLDKAKLAGWKKSGIIASKKRFVCELASTESIAFPIMNKKRLLVPDSFLKTLAIEANKKLEKSWEKIQKLERII